jgi:hypothetical protein
MGVPFGKAYDTSSERELLEAKLPSEAEACRIGLGKFPGHAANSQFFVEGIEC